MASPTEKQREKFSAALTKKLTSLDLAISKTMREIDEVEARIAEKVVKRESALLTLEAKLHEYSETFSLNWLLGARHHSNNNSFEVDSQVRMLIQEELDLQRSFYIEKARLEHNIKRQIAELQTRNPGKLRRIERRKLQKLLDDQESEFEDTHASSYPRAKQLAELQKLLRQLGSLGAGKDQQRLDQLRNRLAKVQEERTSTELQQSGEAFDMACLDYVNAERAKRREASLVRRRAQEEAEIEAEREKAARKRAREREERRQRARVSALKPQVKKSERFLRDHSEHEAQKRLQKAVRIVRHRELQRTRAEQACIRKVKQLQMGSQSHLVPKFQTEKSLLENLRRRDWHQIPTLDNLVANLRERDADLASSRVEVVKAKALLERINKAQDIVKEYNKYSHLLSKESGRTRGIPPRIPVENWDDAEELAVRYIKWLGFKDAKRTGAGSDEGKDVESSKCVVQVKDLGTGATRPMLQQLFGVASAEKKIPVFFSRSYARTALEWGEKHRIALFKFDLRGTVTPLTETAKKLVGR